MRCTPSFFEAHPPSYIDGAILATASSWTDEAVAHVTSVASYLESRRSPFGRWHPLAAGTLWPQAPFGRWSLGQTWTVTFFFTIGKTDKREAETHQRLEECSRRRLWQAIFWVFFLVCVFLFFL